MTKIYNYMSETVLLPKMYKYVWQYTTSKNV